MKELDSELAADMADAIMHELRDLFIKRQRNTISALELEDAIDMLINHNRIYELPIIEEQLDTYHFDRTCRLIYQYLVARCYRTHGTMGANLNVISSIIDKPVIDTYVACLRLVADGCAEWETVRDSERRTKTTDTIKVSSDLTVYWQYQGKIAEEKISSAIEYVAYKSWKSINTPS